MYEEVETETLKLAESYTWARYDYFVATHHLYYIDKVIKDLADIGIELWVRGEYDKET